MNRHRPISVMAIVNLTDDSFYSGSRCAQTDEAIRWIDTALSQGADIIDLGACSTRPGSVPVGEDEEWRRLCPVLTELRAGFPGIRISIDTYWAEVVSRAYDLIGSFIVNDISAGEDDSSMLPLVGRLGLPYVAMHKRGTPANMQSLTDYDDVVGDVLSFFKRFAEKACQNGISDWIADPGFGFAKTVGQNYTLLASLERFRQLSRPLLVGLSRKSMIYKPLNISPDESLTATQVLHLKALEGGADILRVHDVAETLNTIALYRLMQEDAYRLT